MTAGSAITTRVRAKLERWLARRGYEIARTLPDDPEAFDGRRRALPLKFAERLGRAEEIGWFESPEETAVQYAAARFIGDAKRILCVGPGVGAFESFVSVDASLEILGVLPDPEHHAWCSGERAAPNVTYVVGDLARVGEEYGRFDLAFAIDVIDRRVDFADLLAALSTVSDRAIITGRNRARDFESLAAQRPREPHRVREWTAGEFYWVLRSIYAGVELFGMEDPTVPVSKPVGLHSRCSQLLAVCEN